MEKKFTLFLLLSALSHVFADQPPKESPVFMQQSAPKAKEAPVITPKKKFVGFKAFTAKVSGNSVRMRLQADIESQIIQEAQKGELITVIGQHGDFYAVAPPTEIKAYVFRSFILDNIVEGNRVNVRLSPDLNAHIIGHLNAGDKILGTLCPENNKWYKIDPPENTRFYIAKEFLEYAGGPDVKVKHDQKKLKFEEKIKQSELLVKTQLPKPFQEIGYDQVVHHFETLLDEYKGFSKEFTKLETELAKFKEDYLQKKIAYLEEKSVQVTKKTSDNVITPAKIAHDEDDSDRVKMWDSIEKAVFTAWSKTQHNKNMNDFYEIQRSESKSVSGIIKPFNEPIKNKPGDFIITDNGLPLAYVYSTCINLDSYIGKKVTLYVNERSNNYFAFPAYHAIDCE